MSVFNLSYAVTEGVISTLRNELIKDPIFQPGGTGQSRKAETIVLNAWGYQVQDFPIVVVIGAPGVNRRAGVGDRIRPFFGVALANDDTAAQTPTLRTFSVPLAIQTGTTIEVRHVNPDNETTPKGPFEAVVQEKEVPVGNPIHFIEIAGTAVGDDTAFPLSEWEASTKNVATGDIFGGWYDMTLDLTVGARSTQTRSLVADTVWSLLWFTKKRELAKKGIVVLDVRKTGLTEKEYGADKAYFVKFSVSLATEFVAIVQNIETVADVTVEGTATNTL